MKRTSIVLAILTSCCLAQQDPLGDGRDAEPYIPSPNIRVFLQHIEIAGNDLTTISAGAPSGADLHTRALELVGKRTARIVDSAVTTMQTGVRSIVGSHQEFVFPMGFSENDPPNLIPQMAASDRAARRMPWWIWNQRTARELPMQAWWTKNIGIFHEMEASITDGERSVELRIEVDVSAIAGMAVIKAHRIPQGDDSIRVPLFETRRVTQNLNLHPGVWEMASILDPLPRPPVPAQSTKVILFVRCEVSGAAAK